MPKPKNPTYSYETTPPLAGIVDRKDVVKIRDRIFTHDGKTLVATSDDGGYAHFLDQETSYRVEEADRALHRVLNSAAEALERLHRGDLHGAGMSVDAIDRGSNDAQAAIGRLQGLSDAITNLTVLNEDLNMGGYK